MIHTTSSSSLPDRFAASMRVLCGEIEERGMAERLLTPIFVMLVMRLQVLVRRVARGLAHVHANRPPMGRADLAAWNAAEDRAHGSPRRRPGGLRLPIGWGWLLRMVPRSSVVALETQVLIEDAEMQALLARSSSLRRAMRPLCRALALPLPPMLQAERRPSARREGVSWDAEADRTAPAVVDPCAITRTQALPARTPPLVGFGSPAPGGGTAPSPDPHPRHIRSAPRRAPPRVMLAFLR